MGTQEGTVRDGGILGIAKPDAKVEVVRAAQSRPERYQVVLPRQDDRGWRMARVEAASGRRELIAPDLCGARSIHLSVVTLPVGLCDQPHWHVSGEKVMYVVSGHGRIHGGEELEDAWDIEPGVGRRRRRSRHGGRRGRFALRAPRRARRGAAWPIPHPDRRAWTG